MPLFEFKCKTCEKTFEKIQKSDEPNPPCPENKDHETEKLISRASFVLMGGGWYKDGYGK